MSSTRRNLLAALTAAVITTAQSCGPLKSEQLATPIPGIALGMKEHLIREIRPAAHDESSCGCRSGALSMGCMAETGGHMPPPWTVTTYCLYKGELSEIVQSAMTADDLSSEEYRNQVVAAISYATNVWGVPSASFRWSSSLSTETRDGLIFRWQRQNEEAELFFRTVPTSAAEPPPHERGVEVIQLVFLRRLRGSEEPERRGLSRIEALPSGIVPDISDRVPWLR